LDSADIEAYLDPFRLPSVYLAASDAEFGGVPFGLFCSEWGFTVYETAIDFEEINPDGDPVVARVRDARVITDWQPGNGSRFATWHAEIDSVGQIEFRIIRDGVEVPVER